MSIKKTKKRQINIRMPIELERRIRQEVVTDVYSMTDFILDAVYDKLNHSVKESELLIENVSDLCVLNEKHSRRINQLFLMIDSFIQQFLLYNPEIPKNLMSDAKRSAASRYMQWQYSFGMKLEKRKSEYIDDVGKELEKHKNTSNTEKDRDH